MKTAKQALALIVTVLLIVGSMSIAASAAYDLQAAINGASEGATVTLPGDVTATVVIDKELTLDLGGYTLTGKDGQRAIIVKNADVTVQNGRVYSKFANVRSIDLAKTVVDNSPSAILVDGGSLVAAGLRVVGSIARIPTTTQHFLPTGSAIEAINDADVTVVQSSLIGRYGVNNNVNDATPGGTVTIEDGILLGFMRVVKDMSKLELGEDTEDVNAADRLEGFLNNPYKLEAREKKLMKTVFADRLHIYTKAVTSDATVTPVRCDGAAQVKAYADESRVWENNTSTDASYKYVPVYVVAGGKLIAMAEDGDAYTADLTAEQAKGDLLVKYRLEFVLQDDVKGVLNNFDQYLELLYSKAVKTVNEVYEYVLEKYNKYMDALYEVDDLLQEGIDDGDIYSLTGKHLWEIDEYQELLSKLFALGGAVMVNKGEFTGAKLPDSVVYSYTGEFGPVPEGGIYGVLDRVAKLKNELETYVPLDENDQSKWPEMVKWAYDNYEEVLSIMGDLETAIYDIQEVLNTDKAQQLISLVPKAAAQAAKLDKATEYIDTAGAAVEMLLGSHTVQTVLQKLEKNEDEIIPYTEKFINIYNNHASYFTPDKYLVEEGAVAKAYAVYGDVTAVSATLRHQWKEVERIPATFETTGKVVCRCEICGAEKEAILPMLSVDVLWAGYEQDVADEELLDSYTEFYMYVVARKGEDDTPMKVQIRSSEGTMTYNRDNTEAVKDIIDVEYNGEACELWCINRGMELKDDTYVAVAKYTNARGFADITDEEGASFTVETPEPEYDNTVYEVSIAVVDDNNVVTFDGMTKQTITVVTGADVVKVQLHDDDDDGTMTYNKNNATIVEDELEDGTPVLVWTIERLFAPREYKYSIYTRSALGLLDSDKDLQFTVKAPDAPAENNKVLSASAVVNDDNTVVFTVKTTANAIKVRFTNTGDNGTMTFNLDNPRASVESTDNGETLTWTITIQHVPSGKTNYNVQSLATNTYSDSVALTVTVPAEKA